MVQYTFTLNNKPMSLIEGTGFAYPAYSGAPSYRNKPASSCTPMLGAIPLGRYAIVDRETPLGTRVKDAFLYYKRRSWGSDWFALYALDGQMDDETLCDGIRRGEFRIHPAGTDGISQGCVTLPSKNDFFMLRNRILSHRGIIPGTEFEAYGVLNVVKRTKPD